MTTSRNGELEKLVDLTDDLIEGIEEFVIYSTTRVFVDALLDTYSDVDLDVRCEAIVEAVALAYATADGEPETESGHMVADYRYWWIDRMSELKHEAVSTQEIYELIGTLGTAHAGAYKFEYCLVWPLLTIHEDGVDLIPIWNDDQLEELDYVLADEVEVGEKLTEKGDE